MVKYVNQLEALEISIELTDRYMFSVEQLAELDGLSAATAIYRCYKDRKRKNVLICCGPGLNGFDGLVCGRHLKLFGFNPHVYCPVPNYRKCVANMLEQYKYMEIPMLEMLPSKKTMDTEYDIIIDAIFGTLFKPPIMAGTYDFERLINEVAKTETTLCCIDVPSGWHVDNGCLNENALKPEMLISLPVPKRCALTFKGKYHFMGGRYIPAQLNKALKLNIPAYPETECVLRLT